MFEMLILYVCYQDRKNSCMCHMGDFLGEARHFGPKGLLCVRVCGVCVWGGCACVCACVMCACVCACVGVCGWVWVWVCGCVVVIVGLGV